MAASLERLARPPEIVCECATSACGTSRGEIHAYTAAAAAHFSHGLAPHAPLFHSSSIDFSYAPKKT